jgi:hypothetical protein
MRHAVSITIPALPPRECNGNWHGHWRTRSAVAREWRLCAWLATRAVDIDDATRDALVDGCVMDIEVGWDGRRKRMDSDNLVTACKPARDGIADALFAGDDSRMQVGTVTQRRGAGVTIITLRAHEAGATEAAPVQD